MEWARQVILTLPATPGLNHDGGKLLIGPDNFLYIVIGDLNHDGELQNFTTGANPDDTSVIMKVDHNGNPVPGFLGYRNGPNFFDEINPVNRGFNSGWEKVMGPMA